MPKLTREQKIVRLVEQFITHHQISCAETIWRSDHITDASSQLVSDLCEVVGYHIPQDEPESTYAEFNRIANA